MKTKEINYADWASFPENSLGRLFEEEENVYRNARHRNAWHRNAWHRNAWHRDRDRIIHSKGFRRLQNKTQVLLFDQGDHYRTRLTHTLEVAQIARSLARMLRANEELTAAIALAHDLGHSPFGHEGEKILNELMADYGGFSHNHQSFRMVTLLEQEYIDFDGLNLTWETLEGIAKHNGPLANEAISQDILFYDKKLDLKLSLFPSIEAQIAAKADDIAYNCHDIDDGLRARYFDLQQLRELKILKNTIDEVQEKYPKGDIRKVEKEIIRRIIHKMIVETFEETLQELENNVLRSVDDVRNARKGLVHFPESMEDELKELKDFLHKFFYRNKNVLRSNEKTCKAITKLFCYYNSNPEKLPSGWKESFREEDSIARRVCDYIAGMTDRYALSVADKTKI